MSRVGIESCEKWRKVRLALDEVKETYNPNAPAPSAAEGRPDGTKKVRVARDVSSAAEQLQASIEQCIADVKSMTARREEKSNARWSTLMINVAAKKRNIGLEFLMGADTSTINEKVKACGKEEFEKVIVWGLKPGGAAGNSLAPRA
ncbi:methionyl-trna synthetase [Hordeum vulgare]|nr:methionyl-trna synthetase [Hordeum vulgare]